MADSVNLGSAYFEVHADTAPFKNEIKGVGKDVGSQTLTSSKQSLADFKNQISSLRAEARALGMIISGLNRFGSALTRAIVAPLTAISTLGVRKFLQTTDLGALELKKQLKGLTESWDQMLARIGAAIYRHTELSKIIQGIKNFMDSIDEKKIMKILEVGKWAAILLVVVRISSYILSWVQAVVKMEAAFKTLQTKGWFGGVPGDGGTAAPAAGSAAGQYLGSSAGAAAGAAGAMPGIMKSAELKFKIAKLDDMQSQVDAVNKVLANQSDRFVKATMARNKDFYAKMALLEKEIAAMTAVTSVSMSSKLTVFLKSLGTMGKIIGAIAAVIISVVGYFQGFSNETDKMTPGINAIMKLFEIIGDIISLISKSLYSVAAGVGGLLRFQWDMATSFFKEDPVGAAQSAIKNYLKKTDKLKEMLFDAIVSMFGMELPEESRGTPLLEEEARRYGVKAPEGIKYGSINKPEKFSFGSTLMGPSSPIELNRIFQEMALQDQVIDLNKEQLKVLREIETNTADNHPWPTKPALFEGPIRDRPPFDNGSVFRAPFQLA